MRFLRWKMLVFADAIVFEMIKGLKQKKTIECQKLSFTVIDVCVDSNFACDEGKLKLLNHTSVMLVDARQ